MFVLLSRTQYKPLFSHLNKVKAISCPSGLYNINRGIFYSFFLENFEKTCSKLEAVVYKQNVLPTSLFASVSFASVSFPSLPPVIAVLVSLGVGTDDHLGGVALRRTGLQSDIDLQFSSTI